MTNGTLVDSNVLLDVLTEDPTWEQWSTAALADAAEATAVGRDQSNDWFLRTATMPESVTAKRLRSSSRSTPTIASACPHQAEFVLAHARLRAPPR